MLGPFSRAVRKLPLVVRWILVPVVTAIDLLVFFLLALLAEKLRFIPFSNAVIFGFGVVMASSDIDTLLPANKSLVAVITSALWLLFAIACFVGEAIRIFPYGFSMLGFGFVVGSIGVFVGWLSSHRQRVS